MKYVGKQKVLAFAVMALLSSGSAHALVDVSAATDDLANSVAYAKEIKFDDANPAQFATGATDGAASGPLDLQSKYGSGLSANKQYFVRYQLSAGEWTDGTATISSVLSAAIPSTGSATASTAAAYLAPTDAGAFIIPLDIGSTAGASTDTFTIDFAPSVVVFRSTAAKPITGNVVTITVTIFEDQVDANNNNTSRSLSSYDAPYIKTSDTMFAYAETDYTGSPNVIDVLAQSKLFTDGTNTAKLCEIGISETAALRADGVAANTTAGIDAAGTASILTVKGDFSAIVDETGAFPTARVFLTTNTGGAPGTAGGLANCGGASFQALTDSATVEPATSVSATEAVFAISNNTLQDFVSDAQVAGSSALVSVCMTTNGGSAIPTSAYEVSYEPVAADGYSVSPYTFAKCAPSSKNGSTADVPLVANVASAWPQYMRVSNPTGIGGVVHVYAIDDLGTKYGPMDFSVVAGGSTGLITVQNILDGTGANALDVLASSAGTAGVGKLNKLRLWVEAEFGSGHNNTVNGVTVRTYVTPNAAEGGAFTQFQ